MVCEITNDFLNGCFRLTGGAAFGREVGGFVAGKGVPAAVISKMGGADLKIWLGGKTLEVCRRTDDAAGQVNQCLRSLILELFLLVLVTNETRYAG